jgi:hypothetical protein
MLTLVLCVVGLLFWFMQLRLGLIVVKYSAVVVVGVVNDFHFAFVVVVGGIKWSVNVVVSESS